MPAQMSLDTVRAIAFRLSEASREHAFATVLHGGEPLLLGPKRLQEFLEVLRSHLPDIYPVGLQTNGILLTQETLDICSANRVSISISIDGPRGVHDANRIGHDAKGTFDKVVDAIRLLNQHKDRSFLFTGVLSVVDPSSNPNEVYTFLKSLDPPSIDFLYRDGNHSNLPSGKRSPISTEYGAWFCDLLGTYLIDPSPIRIRFLDDLMRLVLGGRGTKDGVGVTDYAVLVFDTDGSVAKNDTLKSAFDGADRFDTGWNVKTDDLGEIIDSPAFRRYHAEQYPASKTCQACPDLRVCGGGMTLHRWSENNGFDNPSVYCPDQKMLIAEVRNRLASISHSL